MQGFECRNKESKNTVRHFSNGIENIAIPNLKRLWDVFSTGFNHINKFIYCFNILLFFNIILYLIGK